ncbi:hypothetical protein F5B22DRAFT_337410 [Xylaria bambusicola]|uniref:uncharacterized protein n=1 Tax=Xylaria bambusicola TaxID=326684 RepID=UPI00200774EE|nr:uncharacterized protein F5B22DRAFT_337410 [Xylaria bambusicola]KAI0525409.1 hypothetical protein F5B22DRAFT_337410 [Xylaria bambusicola]
MKSLPDEKEVYLALRNVFEGQNAKVSKLKTVRKLIDDAVPLDAGVSNLTNVYGISVVSRVAQALLQDGIFLSLTKAKIRFPYVGFSQAQGVDWEVLRSETVVNEADTTAEAARGGFDNFHNFASQVDDSDTESFDMCPDSNSSSGKGGRPTLRSLSSVNIPLPTQHLILTYVQRLLEEACFDFGSRAIPEVLKTRQWDCPEAAELNLWVPLLRQRQGELFGSLGECVQPYGKLLGSLADLRHIAVHRVRIDAQRLEMFLLNAEKFTALLKDATRREVLAKLRLNTKEVIGKLESNKRILACRRAELDRVREMGVAELEREESEYQASAVKSLKDVLAPLVTLTSIMPVNGDVMSMKTHEVDVTEDNRPVEPILVSEHAVEFQRARSLQIE